LNLAAQQLQHNLYIHGLTERVFKAFLSNTGIVLSVTNCVHGAEVLLRKYSLLSDTGTPCILRDANVHCHIHKSSPLVTNLSHANPLHDLTS